MHVRKSALLGAASLAALLAGAGGAHAQQAADAAAPAHPKHAHRAGGQPNDTEAVIVTGTRELNRKATDSLSPIQVVSAATLRRTGQTDLRDALVSTVPSITRQSASGNADTGAFTDAIRLRGLNPDDTLVLMDGVRRHTTANIYFDTGPQEGSTPTDLDMIPGSLIDHIEILQDGAAAQYGSDAVAGVVNVILKHNTSGGSVQALTGQTDDGDGFKYEVGGEHGYAWGPGGYIDVSLDVMHQDHTIRSGVDTRTGALDNEVFGSPEETRENLGIDFGRDITENIHFYGNITYGHRHGEGYENYRLPSILPSVYPNGFTPIESLEENDYAATLGIKGDDFFGWTWNVSTTYGGDQDNIGLKNSVNVSYDTAYGSTPTSFYLGSFTNGQWTNNLDLTRKIKIPGIAAPLHLAIGAEQRMESYEISPGVPQSYYGSGTQARDGYSPYDSGTWYRDVYAAYADAEQRFWNKLDIDIAGRFEHYTDAGNTENGKISARYDFTRRFAIRATISNGFRAPTLAEEHFSNLAVSPTGANGQLAVNSEAARLLGAVPLKPERSTNVSAGFVVEPVRKLHVTADVYQINIRDQIIDGDDYSGTEAVNALRAAGVTLSSQSAVAQTTAQYFSNGASTRTQGLDITAEYPMDLQQYGFVNWSLGVNLNRTTLTHLSDDTNGNPLLTAQGINYLTEMSPRSKIILQGHYTFAKFDLTLRETRYGQTRDLLEYYEGPYADSNSVFFPMVNRPKFITDLEVGYSLTPKWHVAIGANDIFDVKPTQVPVQATYLGAAIYDEKVSQIGIDGGFYYARVNYTF